MTKRLMILVATVAISPILLAQPKPPEAPAASQFGLTIYSNADPGFFDPQDFVDIQNNVNRGFKLPGYGVVRDIRPESNAFRMEVESTTGGWVASALTIRWWR